MPMIGKKAPDFEEEACMPDNSFQTIKLSDYKGKYVILFFYPADFTFVCASEVPGFNKLLPEFAKRDCVILGCSTDTKHAHKGWKLLHPEKGGIGDIAYPLIGDKTKKISEAYDCVLDNGGDIGLCVRGMFLLNRDHEVMVEHKNIDPLGRNLDEPLRLLDALIFHENSIKEGKKQVCPASWKLGKKGMTPSMEGVAEFASREGKLDAYV